MSMGSGIPDNLPVSCQLLSSLLYHFINYTQIKRLKRYLIFDVYGRKYRKNVIYTTLTEITTLFANLLRVPRIL